MLHPRQSLKIYDLIALTRPRDREPQTLAMLEAYFDESGIHDGAAVCVIAGYFGNGNQWKALEKKWRAVLNEFNFPLEDFHAVDVLKKRDLRPMVDRLALAIAKSEVYPVSAAVVVPDFYTFSVDERRFMTGATRVNGTDKLKGSGAPTKPYFVPFQYCLRKVTGYTKPGRKATFFFGLDRPMANYADVMFKKIKAEKYFPESKWKTKDRLGDPAFPLASETPQLQAADLYAYLTYKRVNDCYKAKDFTTRPDELLVTCLSKMRSRYDHVRQDKKCLDGMFEETRRFRYKFMRSQ